jgi:hypothetical protein
MRISSLALIVGSVALRSTSAASQRLSDVAPYLMADRAAEVALARTAAPPAISDSATVLVLTRKGYVQAVAGSNGFTCLVIRSFSASVNDPEFWNRRVRAPHCFNPPAARTLLPVMLANVEWLLSGMTPVDVEARTRESYASGRFSLPARGAMAYMLSPQQYITDRNPHWLPHLMLYFDRSLPASTWGAGDGTEPIIDATTTDPTSPVLTLLVPVRRWSDGTLAIVAPKPETRSR